MDVVNVVFAGAKNYQSTVKPISCAIIPQPTGFFRFNELFLINKFCPEEKLELNGI